MDFVKKENSKTTDDIPQSESEKKDNAKNESVLQDETNIPETKNTENVVTQNNEINS